MSTITATSAATVAQSTADAYKTQRLNKAAHQFEAMLLGEMLKPLGKTEDETISGTDGGSNPLQTFGVEAVAGALANSGALGFARQIEQALQANHGKTASSIGSNPVENKSTKVLQQP